MHQIHCVLVCAYEYVACRLLWRHIEPIMCHTWLKPGTNTFNRHILSSCSLVACIYICQLLPLLLWWCSENAPWLRRVCAKDKVWSCSNRWRKLQLLSVCLFIFFYRLHLHTNNAYFKPLHIISSKNGSGTDRLSITTLYSSSFCHFCCSHVLASPEAWFKTFSRNGNEVSGFSSWTSHKSVQRISITMWTIISRTLICWLFSRSSAK